MTTGAIRTLLVVWAIAVVPAAIALYSWPGIRAGLPVFLPSSVPAAEQRRSPFATDSLVSMTVRSAPFRRSRVSASVPYDPSGNRAAAPSQPPIPKPALSLAGIVWSSRPTAVVEGLPGVEGAAVFGVGDELAGIRVKRIDKRNVVVTGFDTLWNLKLKEPWK